MIQRDEKPILADMFSYGFTLLSPMDHGEIVRINVGMIEEKSRARAFSHRFDDFVDNPTSFYVILVGIVGIKAFWGENDVGSEGLNS